MQENSEHIDQLIARYLAGEATDAERQELEHWMDSNESNRRYFEGIRFAESQAIASQHIVKVDVDKAWMKVHQQMKQQKPVSVKAHKKSGTVIPFWLRVAAMVLLVSGLAIYFYSQKQTGSPNYQMAMVATDSIIEYTLSDSSEITLNEHACLWYAKNYGKKERRVKLNGEAFFSVKHDTQKPFIVESSGTYVRVTGTSFNIKGDEADSIVEVCVKTGSVIFFTGSNEGITLIAGETGYFNKNNGKFSKTETTDENVAAYANRLFVFYNTTLNEVFRQLNKVYQTKLVASDEELGKQVITVTFDNDNIDTIIDIISETLVLNYTRTEGNQVIFENTTQPTTP
ncbi:MAG: DUF4974 domain-containing protein [Bacteroidales bacterium]|nr:DUF4974 domain-containing protein [Bacteroidales bacterium]